LKRLLLLLVAALALLVPTVGHAADVQHGIGFSKTCDSTTKIGERYTCSYAILNVRDAAQDTLTITALSDMVLAANGNVPSGNILGSVRVNVDGGATCTATSGDGSGGDPYLGVTSCTLPFNGRVFVQPFSFYTVQASDFNLTNHMLHDVATLTWHDLCDDPAGTGNSNCEPNPRPEAPWHSRSWRRTPRQSRPSSTTRRTR
jgi:hypothetical protein